AESLRQVPALRFAQPRKPGKVVGNKPTLIVAPSRHNGAHSLHPFCPACHSENGLVHAITRLSQQTRCLRLKPVEAKPRTSRDGYHRHSQFALQLRQVERDGPLVGLVLHIAYKHDRNAQVFYLREKQKVLFKLRRICHIYYSVRDWVLRSAEQVLQYDALILCSGVEAIRAGQVQEYRFHIVKNEIG